MKIAIDFDNTLVSQISLYDKIWQRCGYKRCDKLPATWNFSNWTDQCREEILKEFSKNPPDLLIKLKPFTDVQKTVKFLHQEHLVEIVTSRIACYENYRYIITLFPYIDHIQIVGQESKVEYLNEHKFDLWIDDYPKDYHKFNGQVLLIQNNETLYNHNLFWDLDSIENINDIYKLNILKIQFLKENLYLQEI